MRRSEFLYLFPVQLRKRFRRGGQPLRALQQVRKDRVTVSVDGKVMLDWKAKFARLSLRPAWAPRDAKLLFLGSNKCVYKITKWVLYPVGAR